MTGPRYYIEQARAGHWNVVDRVRMIAVTNRNTREAAVAEMDRRNRAK